MKKILLTLVAMLVFAAVATAASAVVDVSYNFNLNNAEVEAYNCLNDDCSAVGAFSGSFPNGQATASGQLAIRFPTYLASDYGYALYYYSSGYVPMEYRANWYGNGATAFNINFYKINECRATVESIVVVNDAAPFVPLQISTSASLSALTWSPFTQYENFVAYVPPARIADYYSADTVVTLEIYDVSGNIVDTQAQSYTAATGNALYMDNAVAPVFSWTPALAGSYRAVIRSDVIDNQCASTAPMSSEKEFSVLADLPANQCYMILNNLYAQDWPEVGYPTFIDFESITNHADASSQLTPVPSQIDVNVADQNGNVVYSQTANVEAAPDPFNALFHQFGWTPGEAGEHTITVSGIASTMLCAGSNAYDTISTKVYVNEPGRFSLAFHFVDGITGQPIQGATITVANTQIRTDASGAAAIAGLEQGDYYFEATHPNYETFVGNVFVGGNVELMLAMWPGQGVSRYSVTFTVTDAENNNAISGATIDFAGNVAQTDEYGMYQFIGVVSGIYDYVASSAGYLPASGTIDVNADLVSHISLSRNPEFWPEPEFGIHISAIRIPAAYEYKAGDTVEVTLSFSNSGDENLEDIKAYVTIPEFAVKDVVGPFDLKKNKKITETLYIELPEDAEAQSYYARIVIDGDKVKRVVYREFEVTDE